MSAPSRPLILVRRRYTGKVASGPVYLPPDVSEKVPGPHTPKGLPRADFSQTGADIEPAKGTFSEVSYPPYIAPLISHHLDPVTVEEVLGPAPTPEALNALHRQIVQALVKLEGEVRTGALGSGPLLVRGRPLADYLSLDELAGWLRRAKW